MRPVAVLSTTVLPRDGVYIVVTLPRDEVPDLTGVPHYIGHPATKAIVEGLGAVQAPTKLFKGLETGEVALCFSIAQGKSSRATDGFTSPHQDVDMSDLSIRLIKRIDNGTCHYCDTPFVGHSCLRCYLGEGFE